LIPLRCYLERDTLARRWPESHGMNPDPLLHLHPDIRPVADDPHSRPGRRRANRLGFAVQLSTAGDITGCYCAWASDSELGPKRGHPLSGGQSKFTGRPNELGRNTRERRRDSPRTGTPLGMAHLPDKSEITGPVRGLCSDLSPRPGAPRS